MPAEAENALGLPIASSDAAGLEYVLEAKARGFPGFEAKTYTAQLSLYSCYNAESLAILG